MSERKGVSGSRGHQERVRTEVERRRKEAKSKGESFTALTDEQLSKKLKRKKSPMIIWQSWTSSAPRGGTVNYNVGIYNPDPTQWIWLFAHVFVGPGNIPASPDEAVQAVDARFPRLTQPKFAGLSINPTTTQSIAFSIPVPGGVETSNYMGNSVLFHSVWHDPGLYLDRSIFVFEVT